MITAIRIGMDPARSGPPDQESKLYNLMQASNQLTAWVEHSWHYWR